MQMFRVDLKTFLGFAMPNQCCHAITKLILGWFAGGIFEQEIPIPTTIHIVLPYYMINYNLIVDLTFQFGHSSFKA